MVARRGGDDAADGGSQVLIEVHRRGRGPLLAVGLLAWFVGCGGCEARDEAAAPAASTTTGDAAEAGRRGGRPEVTVRDGRVTVISEGAGLREILERLAEAAGFELEMGGVGPRRLRVHIEDAALRDALAKLLLGLAYETNWAYAADVDRHRLAVLRVGSPRPRRALPERASQAPAAAESGQMAARSKEERSRPSRRPPVRPPVPAEIEAEEAELYEMLDSSDPRDRLAAIEEIDTEGQGLARLLGALGDEDPLVRVAVVTRLEDADGFAVVRGIVSALEDSDPRVVLRAIAAIEMLQDETLIPELGALAGDDDASVRQAAEKAIEFLGG